MSLHPIELSRTWSSKNLDRMLVFCLLDRAMSYEKVCKAFDALDLRGLTIRENIQRSTISEITETLRSAGFRFPNQTASFIKRFGDNRIELETAERKELVSKIPGIGMKLASMFLRNTRGEVHAVLDVHILNFLKEMNSLGKNYLESEKNFFKIARDLGMSPKDLDFKIWEARRIGNRKGKKHA